MTVDTRVGHGRNNEEVQGLPGNLGSQLCSRNSEEISKRVQKLGMLPGTVSCVVLASQYTLTNSTSQNIQIYLDIFESLPLINIRDY